MAYAVGIFCCDMDAAVRGGLVLGFGIMAAGTIAYCTTTLLWGVKAKSLLIRGHFSKTGKWNHKKVLNLC